MFRVMVESPFRTEIGDWRQEMAFKVYLHRAVRDSIDRGEAPFAMHLHYTQVLNDRIPEQRTKGIECGLEWAHQANYAAFYVDYGWSEGMLKAMTQYNRWGIEWQERSIGQNTREDEEEVTWQRTKP